MRNTFSVDSCRPALPGLEEKGAQRIYGHACRYPPPYLAWTHDLVIHRARTRDKYEVGRRFSRAKVPPLLAIKYPDFSSDLPTASTTVTSHLHLSPTHDFHSSFPIEEILHHGFDQRRTQ